ncbi:MAG TPA: (E)-4-hydroxy-3-methylbut-2-enyl-diphosphate synthase [Ignavibacteriaceae bacterium]|jgi:(E)-4-hydroxy-3-methylbut-2-enyl-diphosphate synthase|nr:MAG: 4-hydroxy-3-methylbut-2-en-1-yl diphosphate synthase [Ignavibacteria bacterium ADurb.Bin266]OQY72646.1 MAG: 4-hydroxy-3-methylbut-2-en-1-yl diphosphate synthase [Ignavibacteriales bacterium UTCHB2]HQF41488.1 (E)-4-hydroxy-3-methylbut-2-enyl-diphosphate synthase [Ignavibacteriaceae bacterium]HQI39982.1 (E)-4-hydroxy-3-methylbut-2-enyl-diphosphate synthase [Ignavibacteriaceae bacterium]
MEEIVKNIKHYCNSLTKYSRYKTREVFVGDIPLGGNNPIRIQSMTTTDTMNTIATVEQTIRMVNAGCEYVRITAPSINEAKNLGEIKKELRTRGYNVPLIADIHFTPNAAEMAARLVEKVRINPGNYIDKKKFDLIEYTDTEYQEEIDRIRDRFTPLVRICKEYGTAMRIGTNHGSLSDRIMSRYGDTPLGMVESALEFLRICEDENFHNIVLSMKASNPQVMVQAYRLLINKMEAEGMNYPLHLGVTEAGGGEDGRIKSSLGIGALLEDGIGDTIRVSLTEDPEFEAPVAIALANRYKGRENHKAIKEIDESPIDPFNYNKRKTFSVLSIGTGNVPRVVADYSERNITSQKDLIDIGYTYDKQNDIWNLSDTAADLIYLGKNILPFDCPDNLSIIYDFEVWQDLKNNHNSFPIFSAQQFLDAKKKSDKLNFVRISIDDSSKPFLDQIKNDKTVVLVLETNNLAGMVEQRRVFFDLLQNDVQNPVIIKRDYSSITSENLQLYSATDFGALLIDGFGDSVWLSVDEISSGSSSAYVKSFIRKSETKEKIINRLLFNILQAARQRISKTEYIACPSCGRTLFDLQETTEMIRKKTEHLKGLKIAIMGCIVNGPGEMADADYGYVGAGVDKITLYREKNIVKRNIPANNAVDELINLIKEDGKWVEP